jgi:branched-chain amino acid transport system substrate-binding protein
MQAFAKWLAVAASVCCFAAHPARADEGVTDRTILIGQSAALSGPAQELGSEMRQGALAYFNGVNGQGGINGRQIELRTLDDGYEPDRAAANTRKLINEEHVFALLGYVGTPTSQAAPADLHRGSRSLHRAIHRRAVAARALQPPDIQHTRQLLRRNRKDRRAVVRRRLKNIAVFYQNDAYGKAGLAGVERAMNKRNLKIAAAATVERNSTDVAAAVQALHAAKPDAVIQVSAYKSCAALIREMRKAGSATQFYNVSFVGSRALANELGSAGVGVVVSQVVPLPWSGTQPIVREYQAAMQKAGAADFSFTSLEGYIAAKVLVEGLRRAGKSPTRSGLITALESMQDLDLGGFVVNFSPKSHNGSTFTDLTIITQGGKFLR